MMNVTLNATMSRKRITWRAAYTTALFLFGSLLLGFGLAIAASNLPMHFPEQTMNLISCWSSWQSCLRAGHYGAGLWQQLPSPIRKSA